MKRPAGVTAAAIVAMLGSLCVLLVCAFMAAGLAMARRQAADVAIPLAAVVVVVLIGLGLAGLGVATAVGLLKLKRWARTSILVFSGISGSISLLASIGMAFLPIPPSPDTS